jgi:hypothetical protein
LHHANILQAGLEAADAEGKARREAAGIQIAGAIPGIYVSFESFPGIDLAFESLDPQQGKIHPQLRSIREVVVDGTVVEQATVFIPDGTLGYFLKRIEEYHETANSDKPRHRNLLDRVRSIGIASLEKLWTDAPTEFPGGDDPVWWRCGSGVPAAMRLCGSGLSLSTKIFWSAVKPSRSRIVPCFSFTRRAPS